jgi:Pyruvate/2-oxoacid:ferredoxin oxidoreductase gamma subunit
MNVFAGLKPGGIVILNTSLDPQEISGKLKLETSAIGKLAVLDAVTIARETLGSPIVNSVMLGCFPRVIESFPFDAVTEGIKKVFKERKVAEMNIRAAQEGYERTIVKAFEGVN